jgi:hypothetical protein
MTDLRTIFPDVDSLKAPTGRSLKTLLDEAAAEAKAGIVSRGGAEGDGATASSPTNDSSV